MIKKISLKIVALIIVISGIVAFNQLHYWERSVRIFSSNSEQSFGRETDRRRGGSERSEFRGRTNESGDRFERPDFRNLPDSIRERMISEGEFPLLPDSLNRRRSHEDRPDRSSFGGENNFRDRRHGGSRRGQSINLGNVGLFLAVFALFTLITIYSDRAFKFFCKRKKIKTISC